MKSPNGSIAAVSTGTRIVTSRTWSSVTLFLILTSLLTSCVVEGPTKPSPVPPKDVQVSVGISETLAETIQGGKACVLTPADPTLIPVGTYTCPNGVVFTQPCPSTGCPRVAPQPKKN